MAVAEPQIRSTMLAGLEDLLRDRYGVAVAEVLAEAGLDPNQKPDPAETISLNAYSRMLEIAAARAGDECLGLRFAQAFPRGGTRALGYLVINSPDVRTCLDCLCRYVRLQSDAIEFVLVETEGVARFAIVCGASFVAPRKQLLEFISALIVVRIGSEFGCGWMPMKAEFEYREPRCGGDYELLFGRQIAFDCPITAITVRADLLKSRSANADERLFAFIKEVAEGELERLDRSQDLVWQLGEYIVRNLAHRAVTLDGAATTLARTPRQLQNDLKRSGTTFEEQVAKTRRALTERYLRDSDLPLTEIALMLGFSELSAFTRAARGWLGMPPSQWRQQTRG